MQRHSCAPPTLGRRVPGAFGALRPNTSPGLCAVDSQSGWSNRRRVPHHRRGTPGRTAPPARVCVGGCLSQSDVSASPTGPSWCRPVYLAAPRLTAVPPGGCVGEAGGGGGGASNQHNPQYANYWAPLTRQRHIPPRPAQPRHANDWADLKQILAAPHGALLSNGDNVCCGLAA